MVTSKMNLKTTIASKMEATRRAIQHEYLRLLAQEGFTFTVDEKEPRGIQARVVKAVNQQRHGNGYLSTNHSQVSDWVGRVRQNGYQVTGVTIDYSNSSQNARRFFNAEQRRIRQFVFDEKLKSTQVATVWSD
jgi:hypothetical protein